MGFTTKQQWRRVKKYWNRLNDRERKALLADNYDYDRNRQLDD